MTSGQDAGPLETRIHPADWDGAIADSDGPQLVVAGPGTGKTEFLIRRAHHLVRSAKAQPGEILVLTFSRRAAGDIARRVASQTGGGAPIAATFHSFAHRLLETHGTRSHGWKEMPTLLTGLEQVGLVARLLSEEDPSDWPVPYRPLLAGSTLAEEVADFVLRCRERLLDAGDIENMAAGRPQWRALPAFLRRYDAELSSRGRIDYGALLAAAVFALERPEIQAAVAAEYRYLLIDEYQDTSAAQARLLELLSQPHRNITVTGDPYQSIYSFRGAELTNVAEFPDRFRDLQGRPARRFVLTTSFRVAAEILEGALRVVAGGDLPGGAGPVEPAPHPGRVEAYVFDQASAEAEWIATQIERLHLEQGLAYSKIGLLVRSTRHLLPELSRALGRRRIKHELPDRRLVDHPGIRLVFDLVEATWTDAAAILNPGLTGLREEADRAVRRLLLGPLLSMPLARERDLLRTRRRTGRPWAEILASQLPEAAGIAALMSDPSWATTASAADGFWRLWTSVPQLTDLVADPALDDYRQAWAAFSQVLERQLERDPTISLADFQRLSTSEDFEASPLLSLRSPRTDQLTLTTLHQAKGLEFEVVFIADAAEGVFPDLRRSAALLRPEYLASGRDGQHEVRSPGEAMRFRLQEEMRLAYTAMTRARARVIWTATSAAIDEGERRPSRFLLAASGQTDFDQIHAPPRADGAVPVTIIEAQAMLRRMLTDPASSTADRLAAVAVLAHPATHAWDAAGFAGAAPRGPDRGVIEGPIRLSPSQAESYAACPRRYVFERRLGAGDTFSPYAHFGSLMHKVLELSEGVALKFGLAHADLSQALEALESVWTAEADFGTPTLNEAWKGRGRKLLGRMHERWPGKDAVVVASERSFRLDIAGITWSGRADRVERYGSGRLRIVDYKTSSSQPTVPEAAASLQLGFYLLGALADPELKEWGEPDSAQFWHPMAPQPVREFDLKNLPELTNRLEAIGQGILAERWPATPGRHCDTCPVLLLCPAWPEGREAYLP
ncbi:MAG TPA: ATP-dependent DNA helicase [Acidimicrobiia bacterium]|nr:ATP-dependent DNA helicase [Acidimicrobiia bacterium]